MRSDGLRAAAGRAKRRASADDREEALLAGRRVVSPPASRQHDRDGALADEGDGGERDRPFAGTLDREARLRAPVVDSDVVATGQELQDRRAPGRERELAP